MMEGGSTTVNQRSFSGVLFRSTMPLVLRAVGDEERETLRLLGESHVHGIMDGELW